MSTQKFKLAWIEQFNESIEQLNSTRVRNEYRTYFANVQNDIYDKVERKGALSRKEVRKILNSYPLRFGVYKRPINEYYISSSIATIVSNDSLSPKMQRKVDAVGFLIQKSPIETAKNVHNAVGTIESGNFDDLSPKLLENVITLEAFIGKRNAKSIGNITNDFKKEINSLNARIKTNLSRSIVRDMQRMKREDGKPISFDRLADKLRNKYSMGNVKVSQFENGELVRDGKGRIKKQTIPAPNKWYIDRIINTETHAQNELVRQLDMRLKGFKTKKWVSQKDGSVRQDHKESNMENVVEITKPFVLGNGEKAQYPGDPNLSPSQRINCRCFVIYNEV